MGAESTMEDGGNRVIDSNGNEIGEITEEEVLLREEY